MAIRALLGEKYSTRHNSESFSWVLSGYPFITTTPAPKSDRVMSIFEMRNYNIWSKSSAAQVLDYIPWNDTILDFLDYRPSISSPASFSLITRDKDESASLHPLVHDWCRDRISKETSDDYSATDEQ